MAPVVMVNDTVHQRVKPARVGDWINQIIAQDAESVAKEQPA
jgi:NADH:ubiquinone oxidoreductase subunit E